ncbi:MAG: sodium/proton-translocating pyrophosphatase, partial [Planctomycetota bacterium]
MFYLLFLVPIIGLLTLGFALWKAQWVSQQEAGDGTMTEIAGNIHEGALAFLRAEYTRLAVFVAGVAVLLFIGYLISGGIGASLIAVSFVIGAVFSALAGFIGMQVATKANVRTAQAAKSGLAPALEVAFSGGLVMGLCVVGLGIFGLGTLYLLYHGMFNEGGGDLATLGVYTISINKAITVLSGFSLGASSIALFARVGGGIYTKAADVGADLAGKVYAGIPEDDPRNPATIADNVGDNVGDVAGMGADLFESYVGSIIGTMLLGLGAAGALAVSGSHPLALVFLPLILASVGALVAIGGSFLVKGKEGSSPQKALNLGEFGSAGVMLVLSFIIISIMVPWSYGPEEMPERLRDAMNAELPNAFDIFMAVAIGLVAGILIGLITE